jgi:hypothetical protein
LRSIPVVLDGTVLDHWLKAPSEAVLGRKFAGLPLLA